MKGNKRNEEKSVRGIEGEWRGVQRQGARIAENGRKKKRKEDMGGDRKIQK